jgi:enoyl-CoA hydratase
MPVATSTSDETLLIVIDRPPVNALDHRAIKALEKAFTAAASEAPRNGVVLTGSGGAFSAGVDRRAFAGYDHEQRRDTVLAITSMVAALLAIPVPVVAAINGHALGGGFVLTLGCDYRIAADNPQTKLGMTEAQAGIPFPAGPLEVMRHELAPELLRRLSLAGTVLDPRALLELNILDEVCAAGELLTRSIARTRSLGAQPGFRAVKGQIRGQLARRVAALAASGNDPFLAAFE